MINLRVLRDLLTIFIVVGILVGLLAVVIHYEIKIGKDGRLTIHPRFEKPDDGEATDSASGSEEPDPGDNPDDSWGAWGSPNKQIRIATFNLARLDQDDLDDPVRASRIVQQLVQFHVVAIQGVHAPTAPDVLEALMQKLNVSGFAYEYALFNEERLGVPDDELVNAFLFDGDYVELDRPSLRELKIDGEAAAALFGSFRVKGPEDEAFTFTLAGVHFPRGDVRSPGEPDPLRQVFQVARTVARRDDDVLILGRFSSPLEEERLNDLGAESLIKHSVTTIDGTASCDNILWKTDAIDEYADKFGVVPLLEVYSDMSFDEGFALCKGMPVFAEFDIRED
jgi:hypothetical protein